MIIVGAGCSGLACARELAASGVAPVVIDKSRGVGGRAATRRVEGQPIDHGVAFYHGSDPAFLDALDEVDSKTCLEGWPRSVVGDGAPCLARAFDPGERRLAFTEGVTVFPKSLAREQALRLETTLTGLSVAEDGFELRLGDGEKLQSRTVVLALPLPQSLALLEPLQSPEGSTLLESARALVTGLTSEPCLTLIAGYALSAPVPDWDICYPGDGPLALVSHDSSKRVRKSFHALVYQGTPRFSRRCLEQEPSEWADALLESAASLLGGWAREPQFVHPHRWRFARLRVTETLRHPLVLRWPGGATLGLTGEAFAPGGGVEAAFLAGRELGRELLGS